MTEKYKTKINGKETTTWNSYSKMKQRCTNKNHDAYLRYGGRGITVCQRWLDSFENFVDDMGVRPNGMTLDRIDNTKGYYKENCRWATVKQQCRNRTNNLMVCMCGEEVTLAEASERSGINSQTIRGRLLRGYTGDDLFKEPRKNNGSGYEIDGVVMKRSEWLNVFGYSNTDFYRLKKRLEVDTATALMYINNRGRK